MPRISNCAKTKGPWHRGTSQAPSGTEGGTDRDSLKWLPLATILIALSLVLSLPARAEDPTTKSLEEYLKAARGDVMERRESALRTFIKLDETQSKTFWQLKKEYDAELTANGDARKALLREYAKVYKTITSAQAKDMGRAP